MIYAFLNLFLHVQWLLHSVVNSKTVSETFLSTLLSKRNTLLEQLEYYLDIPEMEGAVSHGNQLASRVSVFSDIHSSTSFESDIKSSSMMYIISDINLILHVFPRFVPCFQICGIFSVSRAFPWISSKN